MEEANANEIKIEILLDKVRNLIAADKKLYDERKSKGEYFNIFNVLGLWSEEVQVHSRFIAELLNPKGSHGLGDLLLKEFIKDIGLEDLGIETENCSVITEYSIGNVEEDSGGRIDILIKAGKKAIIIENKIYASDQYNQLVRYNDYGQKECKDGYRILYLTLDGHESESAKGKDGKEIPYKCISYRDDIVRWLVDCSKLAYDKPLVREDIKQYLVLVKQLTNQNMENQDALVDSLMNDIESASFIYDNYYTAVNKLLTTKFVEYLNKTLSPMGCKIGTIDYLVGGANQANCGFDILYNAEQNKEVWQKCWIGFQFDHVRSWFVLWNLF